MPSRYMQPLRILIQFIFLGFIVRLGFSFYTFVQVLGTSTDKSTLVRPDGIDAFLPISGLLGTASWIKGNGINVIHPAAVIVFITIVISSLLLRRSFCSWICPIATLSEISWKSGFRLFYRNRRLPAWLDIVCRGFKYLLMLFFIYSIVIVMSPEALQGFIQSDYHKIADVRLLNFFLHMSPFALGVVSLLFVLSIALRNPFCRYMCPYGALLGLVAMLSPVRVTRNAERCVSCGVCSQICPTYIDVMHTSSISSPECIACWRCISHCRFNEALSMRAVQRFAIPGYVFAALVLLLFLGGTALGKLSGNWHSTISLEEYVRLLVK